MALRLDGQAACVAPQASLPAQARIGMSHTAPPTLKTYRAVRTFTCTNRPTGIHKTNTQTEYTKVLPTLKTMAFTSRAVRWRARSDMSRCCSGSMCSSAAAACGVLGASAELGLQLRQPSRPGWGAGGVRLAWLDWSWEKGVRGAGVRAAEWEGGKAAREAEDAADSWLHICITSHSPARR